MSLFIVCIPLLSCNEDKELTTGMPEAEIINEITINNLKSANLFLGVGMDSMLIWTVSPANLEDRSIVWRSSDESIVTVSQDGKVKAIAVGDATITIAPSIGFGGTNALKSIPVTVLSEVIKATSIVFTNTSTDVYQTATLPMTYNILPKEHTYDYLTWSSSNESIATVDEKGIVTGLTPGSVTITAHTHDKSGVKGSINITVLESISATDISIVSNQEFALYETYPLNFALTPANATTATVQWKSNDPTIASVSNEGKITTHKIGTVKITGTTANGKEAESIITVAEGMFRKDFSDGNVSPWAIADGATALFDGTKLTVKFPPTTGKYRADFSLAKNGIVGNVALNVGIYRYFAIKMLVANNLVENSNGNGCFILDTDKGRYLQSSGGGNNKYKTYLKNNEAWAWNKVAVYYYDLQESFGGSNYTFPTTGSSEVSTFKFVIADYPVASSNDHYDIYWIRSFKTLDELKAFVDNE